MSTKPQYGRSRYEIELFPKAGTLKVSKGQEVALSGNTGGSGGPHLHFELRDGAGQAVNPLLFGMDVEDHISPRIVQLLIYQRDKEHFYQSGHYAYMKLKKGTSYLKGATPLRLQPGTYSFGLLAKDFFTDTRYRLGINYCWLTVDGQLLFSYEIDRMDFDKGRNYNTHIDYYLKSQRGVNYVRLFKEPFNPYPYYQQRNNGELELKEGDSLLLKCVVEDYVGLRDSVLLWIHGSSKGLRTQDHPTTKGDTTFRVVKGQGQSPALWRLADQFREFHLLPQF